jgi:hypothetical protein
MTRRDLVICIMTVILIGAFALFLSIIASM